jgi:hypothetical protein
LLKGLACHHDWLVVTALVLPEPEEPEAELPEPVLPVLVEPEEAEPEPVEAEELVVEAAVVLVFLARAGSCPDTSWTKTTPQIKANVEAAAASARLRIKATRRRRALSRAATPLGASGCRCRLAAEVVVDWSGDVIVEKAHGVASEGRVNGVRNLYEG